jgi:hypothetical protein
MRRLGFSSRGDPGRRAAMSTGSMGEASAGLLLRLRRRLRFDRFGCASMDVSVVSLEFPGLSELGARRAMDARCMRGNRVRLVSEMVRGVLVRTLRPGLGVH